MSSSNARVLVDSSTVSRKRGAPVLIELLKNRPTRAEIPVMRELNRDQFTPAPSLSDALPKPIGPKIGRDSIFGSQNFWLMVAAGALLLIVVGIITYYVGNRQGTKRTLENYVDPSTNSSTAKPDPSAGTGTPFRPSPLPSEPIAQPTPIRESETPRPEPRSPVSTARDGSAALQFDEPSGPYGLRPGLNYFIVATLNTKDALDAAKYLSENGISVVRLPEGKLAGLDIAAAEAKNPRWKIYVLLGTPSISAEAFRPTRLALEREIARLGKQWKQQNKLAPTTFDQPYWAKWTGN
jgi:hypothetical protein